MQILKKSQLSMVTGAANIQVTRQISAEGFSDKCLNNLMSVVGAFNNNPDMSDQEFSRQARQYCNYDEINLLELRIDDAQVVAVDWL